MRPGMLAEREMQNRAAAGGRAIFASGSPQPDVEIEGRTIASCQGDAATPLSRLQALPTARRRQAVPAMPVSIRTRGPACQRPGGRAPLLTLPGPRAANNLFVFPAIALAAHLGQTKVITDHMLMAAAEARPTLVAVLLSSSY